MKPSIKIRYNTDNSVWEAYIMDYWRLLSKYDIYVFKSTAGFMFISK